MAISTTSKAILITSSVAVAIGAIYYLTTYSIKSRKNPKSTKKQKSQIFTPLKDDVLMMPSTRIASTTESISLPTDLSLTDIEGMNDGERIEYASKARSSGNSFYSAKEFEKAIECYTTSIRLSPSNDTDAAFAYFNRATCMATSGNHQSVIEDCTEAIALKPVYLKAYDRRSKSFELSEMFTEAATDIMICCILEEFKNKNTASRLELVLKKLAEIAADELMDKRTSSLPSLFVIDEFLKSFPFPFKGVKLSGLPNAIEEAIRWFNKKQYQRASVAFATAIDVMDEGVDSSVRSVAYEFSATFKLLEGNIDESKKLFEFALRENCQNTNALVKMSVLYLEKAEYQLMMQKVNEAIEIDPSDPTAWFHRAEFLAMSNDFTSAFKDYEKAIQLKKDFIPAHLHQIRSLIGCDKFDEAQRSIQLLSTKFPKNSDVLNCFGEILAMSQDTDQAIEKFDAAISIYPENANFYLNKALILLTSKNEKDIDEAFNNLVISTQKDPKFESGHLQLGNVLLTKGMSEEAFKHYDLAAKYARNREELISILLIRKSNRIQLKATTSNPELTDKFIKAMSVVQQQQ